MRAGGSVADSELRTTVITGVCPIRGAFAARRVHGLRPRLMRSARPGQARIVQYTIFCELQYLQWLLFWLVVMVTGSPDLAGLSAVQGLPR